MADSFGQIGPEKPDFETDCEYIKGLLRDGLSVRFRYAHLMTGYSITLAPHSGIAAVGVEFAPAALEYVLVSIEGRGAYPFQGPGWIDPGYVGEKLGLTHGGDMEGVARCLELMLP